MKDPVMEERLPVERPASPSTLHPAPGGNSPLRRVHMPVRPAVAGHIKREFQPGPHSQFVEGGAQVVLHHLLAGEQYPGNISSLVRPCQMRIAT